VLLLLTSSSASFPPAVPRAGFCHLRWEKITSSKRLAIFPAVGAGAEERNQLGITELKLKFPTEII